MHRSLAGLTCAALVAVTCLATVPPVQAQMPIQAPEQAQFCAVSSQFRADRQAYQDSLNGMNAIQRANAPPVPKEDDYIKRLVPILGTSGEFKDWVGNVVFWTNGKLAGAMFSFPCRDSTGQTVSFSFANENGIAGMSGDKERMAQGYFGLPFGSPVSKVLATFPGNTSPRVRMSGTLSYRPAAGQMAEGYRDQNGMYLAQISTNSIFLARFTDVEPFPQ